MNDENTTLVTQQTQVTQYDPMFSREQIELLKRTVASGLTDDEFLLFTMQAKRLRLDPFNRQMHAVKRWNSKEQREVMAIQVAIDGLRAIADRTGDYAPGKEPSYTYFTDGSLESATAYVMKYVRGTWHEVPASAYWKEYVQTTKEGKPTQFWAKMPHLMLSKVAEALALRKAFPEQLAGVYSDEEMMQADNVVDVVPSSHSGNKSQPDDIVSIVEEARKLGVTFKVEGDSLRPLNGQKMTPDLTKKVSANSSRIVEYIKANAAPVVQSVPQNEGEIVEPESSKLQPDAPPAVPETTVPKAVPSSTKTTGVSTSGTKKTTDTQNGKSTVERPMSPDVLRDFIHKKAESLNKSGGKVTDRDRQQLAAAMDSAFTDMNPKDKEEKRHRVCKYLTGYESLSSKAELKMPDWYVGALKAWLGFTYKDGKYVLTGHVIEEANKVEHEALLVTESMSPAADFAAECLIIGHTEEEVRTWFTTVVGWGIADWEETKEEALELVKIARTQGVDLFSDETLHEMALVKATELWPVS